MPVQKVLVVDDSWTELTMIATPLRNYGFDVVTAVDGDEALEKVFREHPQCIVLDVVLPKQNGFQLCRRLKSLDASKDIPIILLTNKNTPLDKSWGLRQGADMYINCAAIPQICITPDRVQQCLAAKYAIGSRSERHQ